MKTHEAHTELRLAVAVSASFHFLAFGTLLSLFGSPLPLFLSPKSLSNESVARPVLALSLDSFPSGEASGLPDAKEPSDPAQPRTPEPAAASPRPPTALPPMVTVAQVPELPDDLPEVIGLRDFPTLNWTPGPPPPIEGPVSATGPAPTAGLAPTGTTRSTSETTATGPGMAPGYLSASPPIYPAEARRRRQEGVVLLAVSVNERGATMSVDVKASSGYPLLDRAAMDTVRTWRFVPARVGDRAVAAIAEVPIRFSLSDSKTF